MKKKPLYQSTRYVYTIDAAYQRLRRGHKSVLLFHYGRLLLVTRRNLKRVRLAIRSS